jgi:GTPase SAR1 family protein
MSPIEQKSLMTQLNEVFHFKILIIGESSVGKVCCCCVLFFYLHLFLIV